MIVLPHQPRTRPGREPRPPRPKVRTAREQQDVNRAAARLAFDPGPDHAPRYVRALPDPEEFSFSSLPPFPERE